MKSSRFAEGFVFSAVWLLIFFLAGCASDSRKDRSGFSAVDHYSFGLNWLEANELPRAEASFQKAIELDDKFGDAYIQLGVIYYVLYEREIGVSTNRDTISRYYNQAYNCFQDGLKYSPKNPLAFTGVARLQIIGRRFDAAIVNLLQARELARPDDISTDAIICYELGNCYLAQGKRQEALAEYKNYLQLLPAGSESSNISDLITEIEKQLESDLLK